MSQDQSALTPISVLEQLQAGSYITEAANVLFVFEHIITLGREIDTIWKRGFSFGTVLFALTRYTTTLACSTQLILVFIPTTSSRALSASQALCFATFRAYSLLLGTNFKLPLSGIIYALSLVSFVANIVLYSTGDIEYFASTDTCVSNFGLPTKVRLRCLQNWAQARHRFTTHRAACKRCILLLVNIVTVLFNTIPWLSHLPVSSALQQSLRNISSNEGTSEHGRPWSSVRFVGNMGQTLLAPGEEEDEERWDDELPQGQEEQQEGSNGAGLLSESDTGARDREVDGEGTTSRSQSAGVVGEGV
ncbi:hypothetical protein BDW22DRAFT_1348686 [Trametopsis cervina]|nr:hypothetical protein BDW22DRAFT_1348686 [Trametopsis cervina]